MKSTHFVLFTVILLSVNITSQAQSIYTIVSDDPIIEHKIDINLSPAVFQTDLVYGIGYGIEADLAYRPFKNFEITGKYQYQPISFLALLNSDPYMYNYELDKLQWNFPMNWNELGVSYQIFEFVKKRSHYVETSGFQIGKYSYSEGIDVESRFKHSFKLRGGYGNILFQQSVFSEAQKKDETSVFYTVEGVTFIQNNVVFPDIDYLNLFYEPGSSFLNEKNYSNIKPPKLLTKTSLFYIGISYEQIVNTVINYSKSGKRAKRLRKEVYFDMIYGNVDYLPIVFYKSNPDANAYYEEVLNETQEYHVDIEKNNIKTSGLGFRIGYTVKSPARSKKSTLTEKVQIKKRILYPYYSFNATYLPLLRPASSVFLQATLGFSINI